MWSQRSGCLGLNQLFYLMDFCFLQMDDNLLIDDYKYIYKSLCININLYIVFIYTHIYIYKYKTCKIQIKVCIYKYKYIYIYIYMTSTVPGQWCYLHEGDFELKGTFLVWKRPMSLDFSFPQAQKCTRHSSQGQHDPARLHPHTWPSPSSRKCFWALYLTYLLLHSGSHPPASWQK